MQLCEGDLRVEKFHYTERLFSSDFEEIIDCRNVYIQYLFTGMG